MAEKAAIRAVEDFRSPETERETLARIRASVQSGARDGAHELTFQALGTHCRISFTAPSGQVQGLQSLALEWTAAFEAKYSRFLPGSVISRINLAAGIAPVAIDPETERILGICNEMHFMTRGVFDPTALPLLQIWDWKRRRIPSEAEIAAARELVGWRKVQRKPGEIFLPRPGMGIDLGGMGKELAVDTVARLLAAEGAGSVLVDFGADLMVMGLPADGRPGWHIGLDDPRTPGRCWTGLGLRDAGVATSGDYLRRFEVNGQRYGHIIDVRTGRPALTESLSASVVAPSCMQAGMISTAVFVLGAREGASLLEMPGVAGAVVTPNAVHASRRFYEYVAS